MPKLFAAITVLGTTDSACGREVDRVKAYRIAEANYSRFWTCAAAVEHESTLQDGFSVN